MNNNNEKIVKVVNRYTRVKNYIKKSMNEAKNIEKKYGHRIFMTS